MSDYNGVRRQQSHLIIHEFHSITHTNTQQNTQRERTVTESLELRHTCAPPFCGSHGDVKSFNLDSDKAECPLIYIILLTAANASLFEIGKISFGNPGVFVFVDVYKTEHLELAFVIKVKWL